MEARGGKILEFLKENSHLDLEVPDIAFNVKKSEKTVEAALQKLQQKGLVTARQNEYGRVYWYALPSAPETKTIKPAEVSSLKESTMSQVERSDDEVDLSDLQKADAPSAKKSRKSVSTPPAPPKKKAAAPVSPAAPDQEASLVKLTAETQTIDAVNQEAQAAPKPIPEAVQPEPVDFEAAQPFPKTSSLESEKQDAIASDKNTKMLLPVLVVALVIVGLISLVALKRIGDSSEKIKGLEAAAKSYVTADELKVVKGEMEKIATLQANIAVLGAQIDSLQVTVKQLVDEASKQKKPPVRRRTYRKR